ncbi:LOW QUALITY PROTEIN: protein lethal(3)malignant blood neoplasm 1 [Macrosteles quadrilineatus]|uniref:LOW QUALITY PROTEIN: protein lethal(3)malignant blood neoplasm 1 n=1 Tax=Macrosteles quadrilineatus TaxID=74068 RepID=UPI0023E1918F|nr:LOW QUALITY PROTEIN: protein lethal(3)malignant blood neoplasm 1 [Macrosteles quadrilineatus]
MDLNLWMRRWALLWILVLCRGQTDEDEKRPYKFAFAIEGYQHRSEEKDEKGIIMGEFGFVTGDGVYHVTVYATDENGNFKILKMKNYYIGLPGEGTTVAPTRAPPPTTRATTSAPVPSTTKSSVIKHLEGLMGCSGCIVPIKNGQGSKGTPGDHSTIQLRRGTYRKQVWKRREQESRNFRSNAFGGGSPSLGGGGTYTGGAGGNRGVSGTYGGTGGGNGGIGITGGGGGGGGSASPGVGGIQGGGNTYSGVGGGSGGGFGSGSPGSASQTPSNPTSGPNSGGNYGTPGKSPGSQPTGSQNPNLPPGMSMEDLMALLYKFNYTLKYHGHHESGYRNGNKEGGYFFNGRDGFGRKVQYIANEFGFQPNITLVDLGLKHPDTPQGENEDNELRGNEFKWFYKR